MKRRHFLGGALAGGAIVPRGTAAADLCGCSLFAQASAPARRIRLATGRFRREDHRHEGVRRLADARFRPAVCLRETRNQPGRRRLGRGHARRQSGAVMACIEDFREFLIGNDPMQVEHHWQSMYVHSFYRAGPVIGSAISGIDQALWDIRGKAARPAGVQAAGRPGRSARRARLLSHAGANERRA